VEDEFTSGPWTGFYTYSWGHRERMDLTLSFREGRVSGSGLDPVGPFTLDGRYTTETNDIWWTKRYLGQHEVFYKGCRDSHGIWGTWEIGSTARGGFHIWPEGQGGGAVERAEADIEAPADAVAPTPPPASPWSGLPPSLAHCLVLDFLPRPGTIKPFMTTIAARSFTPWYWPR